MGPSLDLDRYRFISRLGSGGSSTVLLAHDTVLGRRVALKRVYASDDPTARSRLRREAVIGASLSHPNLVSIFDILTNEDGEELLVMEYVEGETLAAKLRRGEKLDVPTALEVLGGLSSALDAIHARGIVHRDVKPGNVLLGEHGSIKLADLGIASVPDGTAITTGDAVLGTFRYMAPEQLEGARATSAVDIYALAAVAFEALSGHKARNEPNPLALARAIASQPPPDLRAVWPQAPAAAADVLRRGMSRDPKDRPPSAGELTARLRSALEPRPTAPVAEGPDAPTRARRPAPAARARTRRPAPVPPTRRPPRRRGALVAACLTMLAAAAVAGIVLANTGSSGLRLASRAGRVLPATPATKRSASRPTIRRSVAAVSARRSKPKPAPIRPSSSDTPSQASSAGTVTSAVASNPAPAPVSPSPPPDSAPATNVAVGSPIDAVETFYRLAASHQYAAAWGLTDPAFRDQLEGYQGLQATMAAERAIIFDGADLVDQSPSSAVVAVRTTSLQDSGTQSCSGTVDLLRAGTVAPGWLLDHIAISCV